MNDIKIKPKEATAIINSLTGGVVPKLGVQHITVGRSDEVTTVIRSLEEVKNGHSMMKFWIGDFGSGKSFMLHLLNTVALKQKYAVTTADFTPHIRLYSNDGKAQALYASLMNHIAIQTRPEGGALHILLEKWIEKVIMQTANELRVSLTDIRSPQYFDRIEQGIIQTVNEISDVGAFDFGIAVVKYYEGFIKQDDSLKKNALRWLKGEYATKTEARKDLGVSEIVNDRNYYDMLKNFCRLFVSIGYSGLVINLDEAIHLCQIYNPGMRQKNYEKMMSMYNDCLQGRIGHLFINIAGTTEVLKDPQKGFYSYGALKTRLKVNKFETAGLRDYAQPVIRLMPLSHDEIFLLLKNLKHIFDFNYNVQLDFTYKDIHLFMEEMYNKPGAAEFLTPREVIRDFLNMLNILRQNPAADKKQLIAAIRIKDEREGSPETIIESEKERLAGRKKIIEKQCKYTMLPPEILNELSAALFDDENILKILPCMFKNEAGTLAATEKRLLFMDKKQKNFSFPYSRISGITYAQGTQHSVVHIQLDNEMMHIDFLPNNQVKPLITLLEAQINLLERKTLAAELKYWEQLIKNEDIKTRLNRMSKIAQIIQEKDPHVSEIFCMRHAETVVKFLKQYYTVEISEMKSEETQNASLRIADAIKVTHQAFEQELNNMFQADMLDINAESAAYMQSLKNRGLIN
ncbi:MAG: DUF2791 family P-loop domain-containing protein [Tannerella sp.]|jgi:hypothetical protein|nr:DUF2791 family P-loop domain-containing protein [Tannerella sp.]